MWDLIVSVPDCLSFNLELQPFIPNANRLNI